MSGRWKGITTSYAILRCFALVCGFCLAFGGIALADKCGTDFPNEWSIKNPPAEDRQAIEDLLSSYAWTIDRKDADEFTKLFAKPQSSYYEMCNTGGSIFKFTLGLDPTSHRDLLTEMKEIARELNNQGLQTRHLVTNTLFHVVDGKTVNIRSTVLVTVQHPESSMPYLDYSADARATFVKGDDDKWAIQSLAILADYGPVMAKKR
jgi:hypothetical protein